MDADQPHLVVRSRHADHDYGEVAPIRNRCERRRAGTGMIG
jgi:hypothetical protein